MQLFVYFNLLQPPERKSVSHSTTTTAAPATTTPPSTTASSYSATPKHQHQDLPIPYQKQQVSFFSVKSNCT